MDLRIMYTLVLLLSSSSILWAQEKAKELVLQNTNQTELLALSKKLAGRSIKAKKQAESTAEMWDYKNSEFNKILLEAIGV